MVKFKINPITLADVEYVASIMHNRWEIPYENAVEGTMRYLAMDKEFAGFCIHIEGRTVGVGLFGLHNDDVSTEYGPWLYLLWVEPEFRGNNLGIEITKKRMEYARKLGYKEVYLDTDDAIMYHKMLGWEEVSTRIYKGSPVTIMRWDLEKEFSKTF